uniref:Putative ribonuclease H-like domain-containing protein n=1 Tax=Tanacetum cinerariifolium TaxID=118510 RepID=A0A6L2KV85_TANCI|nr:putative ribonuclease H-like domain-containing protein [Tanacetum cinerariifolium]
MLHMDLFGLTFLKSLRKKIYDLVVTDDYSMFTWVFFLSTKDETSGILKSFITRIENQVDHKVKVIRCDNETEFKNKEMNQFSEMKGIMRKFSVARTPQQNGVAERRHRTLIKAARTMLADSKTPNLSFMRPFGCPVTILDTKDHLGKFNSKADEGFFVGYSLISKAFRVFNSRTRIMEENLNIMFSESTKASNNVGQARKETKPIKCYILLPLWNVDPPFSQDTKSSQDDGFKPSSDDRKKVDEDPSKGNECYDQKNEDNVNSTNNVNTVSSNVNATGTNEVTAVGELLFDPDMPALEDVGTFDFSNEDEDDDAEEILQFKLQKVWTLVDLPNKKRAIGTKWVFRNKKDERGIVIRNKARLATQRHTQEERIDYDEVFVPVARIEAIRPFLAYASFKDFVVYQMDVKSAFLYGKIEEEELCNAFVILTHEKFQMSSMGELTFFLRLQVKQKNDGIFISQDEYVTEILKKFRFTEVKNASTPMKNQKPLLKDEDGEEVDVHMYRPMIGSLMYLTSSRPDIMFAVCACSRYQVNPKVSHLHAMKRIFRYLKGQPKLGLWYPKDSPFYLVAYTDSDYNGASLDKKSTTEGYQFLRCRLISWQCKKRTVVANSITEAEYLKLNAARHNLLLLLNVNAVEEQFWSTVVAKTNNREAQIHATVDGKKVIIYEESFRRDLQFADEEGFDCLPNSTIFEQLASMGTVAFVIICLASNQKFNFSKWIFDSMGRNLDNLSGKFLMYSRFIQDFLDKQLDGMSNHERKYVLPSNTKKIFRNMRRIGKGFSGRITPLFLTMVVRSQLGKGSAMPTDPHHTPIILQSSLSEPQKTQKPRKPTRKVTEATPNESSSQGPDLGGGPRCQEAMGDTIAQTRFENVSKHSNDSLLARGNTLQSDKDRMKQNKLMELCTNLKTRVLNLEKTKTTQALEITSLKTRVKKLKKKQRSGTHKLKRLYKVGLTTRLDYSKDEQSLGEDASKQEKKIDDINADEDITLFNDQDDSKMFDVDDLHGKEVFVEKDVANKEVSATGEVNAASIPKTVSTAATITTKEITLAQALVEIKTSKPMAKGIVLQEPRKAEKELEANIALIEERDDIQAKIDANYQLAPRLQTEEQEVLTIEEKATLFKELL